MYTHITRKLAFEDIQKKIPSRQEMILENLYTPMTIQEIADRLYLLKMIPDNNRQRVAPRVTELEKLGLLKQVGAKKDYKSRKMVAVYDRVR